MNLILIVLCGTLMGAFNFGFFLLGYYVRSKKPQEGVTVDKNNMGFVKDLMEWQSYGGKK